MGTGYVVKIADFGLGRSLTDSDYYKTQVGERERERERERITTDER